MVELVHPYVSDDGMPSYTLGLFDKNKEVSERLYIPDSLSEKGAIVQMKRQQDREKNGSGDAPF